MRIYNSLTRKIEEFEPINPPHVGMYTCGPTVYDYASIGNFRTYTISDVLVRTLKFNGYDVEYIMNLTDVGHLTGDNEGDADTGEDRMEKAEKREDKNAWDIAKFYSDSFIKDYDKLNLTRPRIFAKATDNIDKQIDLVKRLEEKGLTYKISDGIYFDTKAYEKTGKHYGELSDLSQIKEGARVAKNPEKKDPRDFALWKFSKVPGERHMEWESPWGVGFPGWHIECSAMSMEYLGETFDIHAGGEDLRQTHHPNEIAQSEGATGKPFVNYWMHVAFLKVDGKRMGKSLGNAYTLADIEKKGFDPLSLRYFYMTGHYREPLNFTWEALQAAQNTLYKLRSLVAEYKIAQDHDRRTRLSEEKLAKVDDYLAQFRNFINNDLDTPKALALMWESLKSNIPNEDKFEMLLSFDEVLGLNLGEVTPTKVSEVPPEISKLLDERNALREKGNYQDADGVRQEILEKGYVIEDTKDGTIVKKL